MAKKGVATKVRLVSTGTNARGVLTGYTRYAKKGRLATEKLRRRAYDPHAIHPETGNRGCHVWFEEKKLPSPKKN